MAQINEAELLLKKIERHEHFSNCLTGNEFNDFNLKKNEFLECKNCKEKMKGTETDIIKIYYDKNIIEKEISDLKLINEKELENLKKKLESLENININENEKRLNDCLNNYNIFEFKNNNELKQLDKDIYNLKNEINETKERLDNELDLKKKEVLFKLSNDYKIKLLQYENNKKLEKLEKEKEMIIYKKKIEADKEIELNELKSKSELVKKIISIYKNISLI